MNPDTSNYEILRPCLWFCKGQRVKFEDFSKYYTPLAIRSLIEYGYIKIHQK